MIKTREISIKAKWTLNWFWICMGMAKSNYLLTLGWILFFFVAKIKTVIAIAYCRSLCPSWKSVSICCRALMGLQRINSQHWGRNSIRWELRTVSRSKIAIMGQPRRPLERNRRRKRSKMKINHTLMKCRDILRRAMKPWQMGYWKAYTFTWPDKKVRKNSYYQSTKYVTTPSFSN